MYKIIKRKLKKKRRWKNTQGDCTCYMNVTLFLIARRRSLTWEPLYVLNLLRSVNMKMMALFGIRTQLWSCNPPLTRESTVPCHICIWNLQFCHEDSTTFSTFKFKNANLRPRETLVPSLPRTYLLVIRCSSVLSSPLWPLGWNLSVMTEAVQSRRVPFQYGHSRPTNITIIAVYCNSGSRTF